MRLKPFCAGYLFCAVRDEAMMKNIICTSGTQIVDLGAPSGTR